jgi:hypothetical protein
MDVSATKSFDLEAAKDGKILKVEVKGTTGDQTDAILMSRNEVVLHRNEKGKTALIIVSGISLNAEHEKYVGSGGSVECLIGWDIDAWVHEATAFRLTRTRVP